MTAPPAPSTEVARLDPQALLARAVEHNAGIETLERLVALAKDVRAIQAREAWHSAMAEFQQRCPPVKKTAMARITTARSSYTYRYAPLDVVIETVRPILGPLGLAIAWQTRVEDRRVVAECRVSHRDGHIETSGEIAMPIEPGDGRGASPPQRVGIALTYAKRYALLGILGLAPEDDDDAGTDPIHEEDEGPQPGDLEQAAQDAAQRTQEQKDYLIGQIDAGFSVLNLPAAEQVRLWEQYVKGAEFKTATAATKSQLEVLLGVLRQRHRDEKKK